MLPTLATSKYPSHVGSPLLQQRTLLHENIEILAASLSWSQACGKAHIRRILVGLRLCPACLPDLRITPRKLATCAHCDYYGRLDWR